MNSTYKDKPSSNISLSSIIAGAFAKLEIVGLDPVTGWTLADVGWCRNPLAEEVNNALGVEGARSFLGSTV